MRAKKEKLGVGIFITDTHETENRSKNISNHQQRSHGKCVNNNYSNNNIRKS